MSTTILFFKLVVTFQQELSLSAAGARTTWFSASGRRRRCATRAKARSVTGSTLRSTSTRFTGNIWPEMEFTETNQLTRWNGEENWHEQSAPSSSGTSTGNTISKYSVRVTCAVTDNGAGDKWAKRLCFSASVTFANSISLIRSHFQTFFLEDF